MTLFLLARPGHLLHFKSFFFNVSYHKSEACLVCSCCKTSLLSDDGVTIADRVSVNGLLQCSKCGSASLSAAPSSFVLSSSSICLLSDHFIRSSLLGRIQTEEVDYLIFIATTMTTHRREINHQNRTKSFPSHVSS